jgi:mannose-6-phosphate isomerase-like protein (cupin superfamily)
MLPECSFCHWLIIVESRSLTMSYPDPRYLGENGETSATYHQVRPQPDMATGAGSYHYVIKGTDTNSEFGLYRVEMRPQVPGASPHFHRTISESFYVLSGSVSLYNGERWVNAGAGDFLYVPAGGIHAFRNDSEQPASMLILFVPGAPREEYFEAIAKKVAGQPFTDEEWAEICIRHDNYLLDPQSQALYKKLLSTS